MAAYLTQSRILEALDLLGIHYLRDHDGDPIAMFCEKGTFPGFTVIFEAVVQAPDGDANDRHLLSVLFDVHTPTGQIPDDCLSQFTNYWNNTHRFPTASIGLTPTGERSIQVVASIPYPLGVEIDQLATTIDILLSAANEFATELCAITQTTSWTVNDTNVNHFLATLRDCET